MTLSDLYIDVTERVREGVDTQAQQENKSKSK